LLRRDAQRLSTGELRKVLIARALVSHPQILLLDEVCDGLDAAFRREMLAFIDNIARHGTQVIYTTHRADEVLPAITHELVFDSGRIVRISERRSNSSRRISLFLRANVPTLQRFNNSTIQRFNDSTFQRFNNSTLQRPAQGPLIAISAANVFLGRKKILRNIHWRLMPAENWVVLGGNGAGKTTFLKLLARELYPAVGARVERFGLTAQDTIWDLRRKIGSVSPLLQAHYRAQLTAAQVVATGFFSSVGLMDDIDAAQWRRVRALLAEFGLQPLADRRIDELSFGELRKILTLRAVVHHPRLLVLDEPFDGLDAVSRREFSRALDKIARRGTQLLVVTHHLDDLPRHINRALFLERGAITASGAWPALRRLPQIVELFGNP